MVSGGTVATLQSLGALGLGSATLPTVLLASLGIGGLIYLILDGQDEKKRKKRVRTELGEIKSKI